MSNEIHHLVEDFPEFREKILELKSTDKHFHRLFESYEKVNKEVQNTERNTPAVSDEYSKELKEKRLKLKDEIYSILQI